MSKGQVLSTPPAAADIVIIGGGVIGASIAYYLAKEGCRPLLAEGAEAASGASGACDKAMFLQSKNPGIHLELALESARMFPSLGDELEADLEYEASGGMVLIETEEQLEVMQAIVRRQQASGLDVRLIDREETLERQPAVSPHILGAAWSPEDAHVNPILLTTAYLRAALRLGASYLPGARVEAIATEKDRVTGIKTGQGFIASPTVINAAGAWVPLLVKDLGLDLPIRPRRGQILVSEPAPPLINGVVLCARYITAKHNPKILEGVKGTAARLGVGLSLGQSHSGNLLIGGTREFAGYDRRATLEAFTAIARHAARLFPALRSLHIIRQYAGLRPYTADGLPILGPVSSHRGLYLAAGHEGDGIALAPITGLKMAHGLTSGDWSPLAPYSIDRFPSA